jgi:hypothetical protein
MAKNEYPLSVAYALHLSIVVLPIFVIAGGLDTVLGTGTGLATLLLVYKFHEEICV